MGEQKLTDTEREAADAKMVDDAFKRLLDSYLASPHRKKVDIITKAFTLPDRHTRECADSPENRISCTL